MQIRNCRECNGAGIVNKIPNGMARLPPLIVQPEVSVCLCLGCYGSRRQIKVMPGVWAPHPWERIDL